LITVSLIPVLLCDFSGFFFLAPELHPEMVKAESQLHSTPMTAAAAACMLAWITSEHHTKPPPGSEHRFSKVTLTQHLGL
jgi:hypothetical protein